jgi:membrane associated rhomboid family serine protease
MNSPRLLVGLGLTLMLLGIILPFLILIHVLESTFFLNFFSWGASVSGLFIGVIGVATWVRTRKE